MTETILDRYDNAKALVEGVLTKRLVLNDGVLAHWIDSTDCFWYERDLAEGGREYRLVDAKAARNNVAFSHRALADALGKASGRTVDERALPITVMDVGLSPLIVRFGAFGKQWMLDADKVVCSEVGEVPTFDVSEVVSPDGQKVAFLRDHNLWMRDLSSGRERALTHDGTGQCPYATSPVCGGVVSPQVEVVWSPDSRSLLTHQLDVRGVSIRRTMFPVPLDGGIQSEHSEYPAAFPGDAMVDTLGMVAIQVETGEKRDAACERMPIYRPGLGYLTQGKLGWWGPNGRTAYFVVVERGAKSMRVVEFDTNSGATRNLVEEASDTFVRMCYETAERPMLMHLFATNELILFSERDGWGHLYLYDLETGDLKRRLTQGKWLVRKLLRLDVARRELLIQTSGRDSGMSPYYQDICRVSIDSGELTPLACGPHDHAVFVRDSEINSVRSTIGDEAPGADAIAPACDFLVTTCSRVDTLPRSVLIDREGNEVLLLETAQAVGLPEGWHWPEPVTVKAADGKTELYGVIYRPPGFSPETKYPVLDYSLAFPANSMIPKGSFVNDYLGEPYLMGSAYAALGFVVVSLELPGMPCHSKAFQDRCYGRTVSINAFDDRIGGLRQLADRYPYMDLDRVGIFGCDATTGPVLGLLEHPEFYKVGVNVAFDDPRFGLAPMVEMYEGLSPPKRPYTNESVAALEGKLMLIHGLRDMTSPPETTLQLVDALIEANRNFDLVIEPNAIHIVTSYALRRTWDYFVTHLLELEPPKSFKVITAFDRRFPREQGLVQAIGESGVMQPVST